MELEVSKKVREAIKAKLVELGCHVDDELPDYIMILIANRRSNQEIEGDLGLFLADNTKKFVIWLTHVLKKLEQVTACETAPPAGEKESEATEDQIGNTKSTENTEADGKKGKKAVKDKRKHSSNKESSVKKVKNLEKKDKNLIKKEKSLPKKEKSDKIEKSLETTEKTSKEQAEEKGSEDNQKAGTSGSASKEPRTSGVSKPEQESVFIKKKVIIQRNDPVKAANSLKQNESKILSSEFVKPESVKADLDNKNKLHASIDAVDDMHSGTDTLILDTGENEFSENVDELRRIALESQERKRKAKEEKEDPPKTTELPSNRVNQRKLITSILLSRVKEDKEPSKPPRERVRRISSSEKRTTHLSDKSSEYYREESYSTRHSSRNSSHSKSNRHEKSPIPSRRVLRSPRRQERRSSERHDSHNEKRHSRDNQRDRPSEKSPNSVFSRIGSSVRRSRTRSRSPVRKLTSKIGNVIQRSRSSSADESLTRNSVCSVIKVTERPKRDLHLSNKMLLRAVADAQQSIIQTEQNSPTTKPKPEKVQEAVVVRDQPRKRASDENIKNIEVIPNKRRFTEFPEVNTIDFYEHTEATMDPGRKSVKERLGVKRELRRPIRERLGIVPNHSQSPMHIYENEPYSPRSPNYKIMINVSDEKSNMNGKQRNVMLATNDSKPRISIQVNNSEDDDTSDESMVSEESPKKREDGKIKKKDKDAFDSEFQLAISDEDKLPEVPIESEQEEYEYEEIVEEEEVKDDEVDNAEGETTQELSQASTVDSQSNFSIIINKRPTSAPVMTMQPNLPDLRTMMGRSPTSAVNGSSGVKCKFWPKCQFMENCIYEHPVCKYIPCKNKDCIYKHDTLIKHENFESKPKAPPKLVCKFYPKCTSMNCKFLHPSPCRFGVGCTDSRCENYHPGVTLGIQKLKAKGVKFLPQANQLKWVKK